jgi:hypothetical protein
VAAKQFDEALISFYEEELLSQADAVYRFAFALTLSLDGAGLLVRRTFQDVASRLERLEAGDEGNWMSVLIAECWKQYGSTKGQKFTEGQSAAIKALKPLPVEQRAALVAVDVAGLAPAGAAQAFGIGEKELRGRLTAARRALMGGGIEL